MQPQAFSAKVQILFPHLLCYAGISTTSQVTSSSETVLTEDQVTSLPSPQTNGSLLPREAPPPHSRHPWRRKGRVLETAAGPVGPG